MNSNLFWKDLKPDNQTSQFLDGTQRDIQISAEVQRSVSSIGQQTPQRWLISLTTAQILPCWDAYCVLGIVVYT